MALVSVAAAAERLGVGVPRVHQRIADGSLRAQRIGAQWVVDERSLLDAAELRSSGRPLSARSAWALVALAEGDDLHDSAASERARARRRLAALADLVAGPLASEEQLHEIAARLRSWLRNRAGRQVYLAAAVDLPALREDARLRLSGLSARSGIAAGDLVEAYVVADELEALVEDHLLLPAEPGGNVVLHVVAAHQPVDPQAALLMAADLAEHRGPREERRAVELVRQALASREPARP